MHWYEVRERWKPQPRSDRPVQFNPPIPKECYDRYFNWVGSTPNISSTLHHLWLQAE